MTDKTPAEFKHYSLGAEVIAASVGAKGPPVYSVLMTLPKDLQAQLNKHRILSNSAVSSRAIPFARVAERVSINPYIPTVLRKNKKGMSGGDVIDDVTFEAAQMVYRNAQASMLHYAGLLDSLGLHKEHSVALLEPFMWSRCLVTGTSWENFRELRVDIEHGTTDAMAEVARQAMEAIDNCEPRKLRKGDWHAPFVTLEEMDALPHRNMIPILSSARSARVSYDNHDNVAPSVTEDTDLFKRLMYDRPPHGTPTEHPCTPADDSSAWCRNFLGWRQFRDILEIDGFSSKLGDFPALGDSKR